MGDDAGGDPVGNTSVFPPPPKTYEVFTEENVLWLQVLQAELDRSGQRESFRSMAPEDRRALQTQLLQDASDRDLDGTDDASKKERDVVLPDIDLIELMPPDISWIEQDGGYQLFGQRWPIPEATPTLEQLGIPRMFPPEPFDHAEALRTLLRTMLFTYYQLTNDLLQPIQPYEASGGGSVPTAASATESQQLFNSNATEEKQQENLEAAPVADGVADVTTTRLRDHLQHLETTVINFQYLMNQLRPVQASASLEMLLEEQVKRREEQTKALRDKCESIRDAIGKLSF
ncbi:hypothetical protein MYAM1_003405 [Malassezia yamatoensis]|uniref:Mediator of RNA polymerase II transcription subunit 7 n=1 Tax=Malassezia yamatoensis TaxID=253288 RepID=A0AAJ5YTX5_9BASI|nr:hypothetical protein MYAM1_003405 [Malassezia yamatoensis]